MAASVNVALKGENREKIINRLVQKIFKRTQLVTLCGNTIKNKHQPGKQGMKNKVQHKVDTEM